jgi:hypothetical protein
VDLLAAMETIAPPPPGWANPVWKASGSRSQKPLPLLVGVMAPIGCVLGTLRLLPYGRASPSLYTAPSALAIQ